MVIKESEINQNPLRSPSSVFPAACLHPVGANAVSWFCSILYLWVRPKNPENSANVGDTCHKPRPNTLVNVGDSELINTVVYFRYETASGMAILNATVFRSHDDTRRIA